MPFSEEQVAGWVSPDELKFVRKMHTGGRSGGEGYRYQDHYAVFRMIAATPAYLESGRDLGAWLEDFAPVDDVVLEVSETEREYCQLKTGTAVTWTADEGRLRRQFELQRKICEACPDIDGYTLRVVTPRADRHTSLQENLPQSLEGCTQVDLFPLVSALWDTGSPAFDSLVELCAFDSESPATREAIATFFYSQVVNCGAGEVSRVSDVVTRIREHPSIYLRHDAAEPPAEWARAAGLLGAVSGLKLVVERGFCHYSCGPFRGLVARCDTVSFARFVERVLEAPPTSYAEFSRLLP